MNENPHPHPTISVPATPARGSGPSVWHLAVVVALLGTGILVTALTSDVTKVSEPGIRLRDGQPFLAERAGGWTGGPLEGLTEQERAILPQDTEGARRVYTDAAGNQVYCSIVLAGRDVTSIHRPELCLPGQGWTIQTSTIQTIPVAAAPGGQLEVTRLNSVRPVPLPDGRIAQARSIFAYWFVGKDRVTARHWQRIFWTTKDRVLHNTNHRWAYFLIHVPAQAEGGSPAQLEAADAAAMEVATRFVQDLYPVLVNLGSES